MPTNSFKSEIFYQIYPASFKDSNNDGFGDIQGIISKLPYLKKLGVTFIWISPIYKSPMVDNGYDISDYQAVNERYGSLADLKELFTKVHELGLKIMMDLVVNHTSSQHPWFQAALRDKTSKYRNYYIFRRGTNGNPPNNWRSNFGAGSAWEPVTGEEDTYYLHVFSKEQPDLNWENPELREEIYSMINWWIDFGVDGFRVDAITFLKKDQDFASISPDGSDGLAKIKRKSENRPGLERFLRELKERCLSRVVSVGETSGLRYDQFAEFVGQDGFFSMAFDFHYVDIDVESGSEWYRQTTWTPQQLGASIAKSQTTLQEVAGGWNANFLENHDQPRSLSKFIKDEAYQNEIGAKALALLYFGLRGCPFIYQGQELGLKNFKRTEITDFNDISSFDNYRRAQEEGFTPTEALNFVNKRSRDNGRVPFQWNNTTNFGFNAGHEPYIKLNNTCPSTTASEELTNPNSVFNFYRKLIELRKNSPYQADLVCGDFRLLTDVDTNVIAYQRGKKLAIYINLSNKPIEAQLPIAKVILNNYPELDNTDQNTILQPYQAILVERSL